MDSTADAGAGALLSSSLTLPLPPAILWPDKPTSACTDQAACPLTLIIAKAPAQCVQIQFAMQISHTDGKMYNENMLLRLYTQKVLRCKCCTALPVHACSCVAMTSPCHAYCAGVRYVD